MSKKKDKEKTPIQEEAQVQGEAADQEETDNGIESDNYSHFSGTHKIPDNIRKYDVIRIRKSLLPLLNDIDLNYYSDVSESLLNSGYDVEIQNDETWFIIWAA